MAKMIRGDIDSILSSWADDAVYDFPSDISVGGTIKGKKDIAEWFHRWYKEFPERNFVVNNIAFGAWPLSLTNVVMAEWTCTETDKEGKGFEFDGVSVVHVKNFKSVRITDYISFKGLPQISELLKPVGEV
jgi:ketosteroid isomerase-like protein